MRISIIIPAYNEEYYIGKCLDSVAAEIRNSGILDVEIIVVNNTSTDRTREVAAKYTNVKIVDENKKGLVYARQAGVDASSGELLAHIDSDVIIPHGWLITVIKEFEKSDLVALSGPYTYYDVSAFVSFQVRLFYFITYAMYLLNKHILNLGSMIQGGNFIVRRRAWLEIGRYHEAFVFWGEDVDLARRLHKVGDVKFTFKLPMLTSGRRLIKEGVLKTGYHYVTNYFSVMLRGKPFGEKYHDIRIIK